ncbi:hypothetical protein HOK51_02820 [Candidatus Woesearchaeota archaeon]|jgi:hypothetical protein|nr:hypothetical protein [Candidatus Woesearchaeota archaeon]MBT6518750.1 hypothetical protein [Candidatus Woesearchaeota archaeon]MBT7366950.1 hypothetical protein [Candidatus Woesearchaeota archaeon]
MSEKQKKQGRPIGSLIRQNIVEILFFLGEGYAYDIYKTYHEIFPKTTMRSIYYHLKKGTSTGEFKIKAIKQEHGNFSWGPISEKTYYCLGSFASPTLNPTVEKYFKEQKNKKVKK